MDRNKAHFSPTLPNQRDGQASRVDGTDEPANHSRKRRRIAIACARCRSRKIRCDHIAADNSSGNVLKGLSKSSQAYIRSLEKRLEKFEMKNSSLGDLQDPSCRPGAFSMSTPRGPLSSMVEIPSSPQPGRRDSILITASPEIFMGGKSGVSFTQLILNAMNWADSDKLQAQPLSSPRDAQNPSATLNVFDLPHDGPDLIELFFSFHYELSPIFHAPSALSKFHDVMQCDASRRGEYRYDLAIMNMILAIAVSHQRRGMDSSLATTRRYYDTAMALVGPTLLYDWSIEKVQILLLGARYLQSSNSPDECWNVLGLAIRIAYGLELHQAPGDNFDCIAKEVRKRVWYACYGFDQLLSMIYGRPSATSSATFNTPLPEDLDDDCIQSSRLLFPNLKTPSLMSFSIQVSKLYRLLESASSVAEPQLETLVQLDEAYEAWFSGLPDCLKITGNAPVHDDKILILALRANMVRILIHRQSLAVTLSTLLLKGGHITKESEGLKNSMLQNSRHICVRTAEDTIRLVGLRYEHTKNAVGPTWFNLYYLFNAILIVVSHVVDPEYRDDKDALAHLDHAMRMIRQMSTNHLCAQRAYTFLHQLLGFMDSSITIDGRRLTGARSRPPSVPLQPDRPMTSDEDSSLDQNNTLDLSHPDWFSFWDITQDLTSNLGSQLESYSTLGNGMWSWGAEEQPVDPGVFSPETMNGVSR